MKFGAYEIEAPANHQILSLVKSQPYRELCVGITAKYVSAKYPNGTMVDIGANIGYTAAIMATYARNKLILVEGTSYYFDFLVRNTCQLSNEIVTKKALVADGSTLSGSFH